MSRIQAASFKVKFIVNLITLYFPPFTHIDEPYAPETSNDSPKE